MKFGWDECGLSLLTKGWAVRIGRRNDLSSEPWGIRIIVFGDDEEDFRFHRKPIKWQWGFHDPIVWWQNIYEPRDEWLVSSYGRWQMEDIVGWRGFHLQNPFR